MTGIVVVGAGNMGRKWLRTVRDHPDARLLGLVDVDVERARAVTRDEEVPDVTTGADLRQVLREVGADAVLDATVPAAHRGVATAAMTAGLDVLGEKPAAADLAEAVALAALAEVTGRTFVVSQSRRFNPQLTALRRRVGEIGRVGQATSSFHRGPRFGGFREEMPSPLTVDMAIHLFDMARWFVGSDPVAVTAVEFNPRWSWFEGAASCTAVFEFGNGARFTFEGSWVATGADTSWNGAWRIAGDAGTITWSGDDPAVLHTSAPRGATTVLDPTEGEAGGLPASLSAFLAARSGRTRVENEIHDNLHGLAMVDGVLRSSRAGARVAFADLYAKALSVARERVHEWSMGEDVADRLASWPSVEEAQEGTRPGTPRTSG
ncbi:Gfo/Idh/MocA family oxidoreductase [Phycicoccus sp. BSK3Z-2]|uniref:Gfo/Idh/MocA family oxidoreductase n=1 Tax=Phycicoccus avicenniae TaxID=2828860 RepID=A0A941I294_9MICO|nr:Gfo/Idh/MocA family oxidoreductase [Phycicoccus avicenniae]MBR7744799.1 Gfo/Idh/MocA family oxidoreductase [Phycicoccus avicenniae]